MGYYLQKTSHLLLACSSDLHSNNSESLSTYAPTGDLAHLQLSDLQGENNLIYRTSNLQGIKIFMR